jgi:flagellar hook-basal body complex protein FliE
MDISRIDSLLSQMRATSALAAGAARAPVADAGAAGKGDFAAVLKASIEQVNQLQSDSSRLSRDFESGNGGNLHEVMISSAKANISFQQMVQVRNRLVSAYHDVMNMQV